jgi:hypothetical protein
MSEFCRRATSHRGRNPEADKEIETEETIQALLDGSDVQPNESAASAAIAR